MTIEYVEEIGKGEEKGIPWDYTSRDTGILISANTEYRWYSRVLLLRKRCIEIEQGSATGKM